MKMQIERVEAFGIAMPLLRTFKNAQGPKTIQVQVNDTYEPWTQVDGANRATTPITVRQAGWVLPLVIGGSIGGIVAIGVGLRFRSRIRGISFRRKKKEAKGGEEEAEEDEEEEAEEEEKPRDKKRL